MAQSTNESNVRGIPLFWQNHTVDPPIPWEDWSDLFQLAIIAKENIDIENSIRWRDNTHYLQIWKTQRTVKQMLKDAREWREILKNKDDTMKKKQLR